jgi:hypothetical protein
MSTVDNYRHSNRGVPIGVSHSREPKISSVDEQAAITRVILEQ